VPLFLCKDALTITKENKQVLSSSLLFHYVSLSLLLCGCVQEADDLWVHLWASSSNGAGQITGNSAFIWHQKVL